LNTRVRFAPSPTGFLHIGGLRTALYDYLFAKHNNGKFILRIEDTDRSRLIPGAVENLISSLHNLGIDFDEGPGIGGEFSPYVQSERLDLYHQEAGRLLKSGHAYRCFCSPETLTAMREEQQSKGEFVKYDRRCLHLTPSEVDARLAAGMPNVIRLKMPDNHVFGFDDLIRGHVKMDSSQSDDQVLIKSDGFPTYHLAAVVDDHYMQISHAIRGEEWLSSTPKHLWLYECLGWDPPLWVHLPLILNPDRSKLSKRMNDVSVESYLEKGYLKEALLNFVALLGWHGADDRETYTLHELCEEFTLERVNKAGAVFDLTKLDWMNGWYLRNLPLEEIVERTRPYFLKSEMVAPDDDKLSLLVSAARERCTLLPEIVEYSKMFINPDDPCSEDQEILRGVGSLSVLTWFLEHLPQEGIISKDDIDALVKQGMADTGLKGKAYYTPLRLALLGKAHGPELPLIFSVLGWQEVHSRLSRSIQKHQ
jgi:glutamyl-tRNA synthetase